MRLELRQTIVGAHLKEEGYTSISKSFTVSTGGVYNLFPPESYKCFLMFIKIAYFNLNKCVLPGHLQNVASIYMSSFMCDVYCLFIS